MLGWLLIRKAELVLQQELAEARYAALARELDASKEYARKCESLVDHERARIDSERERADRLGDAVLQSQNLPAASSIVVAEQKSADAERSAKHAEYQRELTEIYGESMEELTADEIVDDLPETAEVA